MMLIIANTERRTVKERDCGITLKISSRKNYAKRIAETSEIESIYSNGSADA